MGFKSQPLHLDLEAGLTIGVRVKITATGAPYEKVVVQLGAASSTIFTISVDSLDRLSASLMDRDGAEIRSTAIPSTQYAGKFVNFRAFFALPQSGEAKLSVWLDGRLVYTGTGQLSPDSSPPKRAISIGNDLADRGGIKMTVNKMVLLDGDAEPAIANDIDNEWGNRT